MNDPHNDSPAAAPLPEAILEQRSRFSLVWLIPLVALAIGAWLAYKTYSEQGPTITITFRTADGLEAGKTKLKYKDVEFGQVSSIKLTEDLSRVIVTAKLIKDTEQYLTEKTRFWVERARVSAGRVSGLGTLFAGAYIAVDPVATGQRTDTFTGLETPPAVTTDQMGSRFTLRAAELGSLDVGSPVYFRAIKVGQVTSYRLSENGQTVEIKIFVNAPYDQLVRTNTYFWNASGFDITLDANGVKVDTASVVSLMIGGLAFETPINLESRQLAEEGAIFHLYPNRQSVQEGSYIHKSHWLLHFTGSVRGLTIGAPVEYRGIRIGQVIDVKLEFDLNDFTARIPVLIEIEADRFQWIGASPDYDNEHVFKQFQKNLWDQLIAKGLRAQLKTGNLLTGALFVDLDVYPGSPPRTIVWKEPYPELPTVPTSLEEIRNVLTKFLEKLQRLPLEQIGTDLQQSLTALRQTAIEASKLTHQLNTRALPEATARLEQLQKTLETADKALTTAEKTLGTAEKSLAADSPLQREVQRMLKELSAAARSFRLLTDYLERHPEALIQGKTR
ncbi:MAG TPA: MlaD family protein [Candidatus Competibacteraceae bacterium]|nr:MCE family protein [Gammaproteobacteria bacterium]HPF58992.1 MlaD family protein [Candidatus Competibacteraceae bacterium]HRY18992.1 MlaD family protein [Candidatus Competibacteraceae bacterium]